MIALFTRKDVLAGLLFLALGTAGLLLSQDYPLGTASRMGPGYVPSLFAGGMIICGVILLLRSIGARVSTGRLVFDPSAVRPLLLILSGIVLFGLLIQPLGLILACLVLVTSAGFAVKGQNFAHLFLLGSGLTGFVIVVMVWAIGMRIDLLPAHLVQP